MRAGFADLAEQLQRLLEAGPRPSRHELRPGQIFKGRDLASLDDLDDDEFGGEASDYRRHSPEEQADLVIRLLASQLVEPADRVREAEAAAGLVSGRDQVPILLVDRAFGEARRTPALQAVGEKGADLIRALLPALREAILSDQPELPV